MKKIIFGLIAIFMFSFVGQSQNNRVPEISKFPKEVSSRIKLPLDEVYNKFKFEDTQKLSAQQENLLLYFSNFSQGLLNNEKNSENDNKTIIDLIKSSNSDTYNWILKNANNVESFEIFHKLIVDKINNSNDLEEINQLVVFDYSMQIVDNQYQNRSWWSRWGKCVTSIVGGGLTGGGTLGLAGAAIGTVALPIVGTVSAGAVGAIVGGVGGALTGAAAGC